MPLPLSCPGGYTSRVGEKQEMVQTQLTSIRPVAQVAECGVRLTVCPILVVILPHERAPAGEHLHQSNRQFKRSRFKQRE